MDSVSNNFRYQKYQIDWFIYLPLVFFGSGRLDLARMAKSNVLDLAGDPKSNLLDLQTALCWSYKMP